MVRYQFKNFLVKADFAIKGDLESTVLFHGTFQMGPLGGKSYQLSLQRTVQADGSVELVFIKNEDRQMWIVSADRKTAALGEKIVSGNDFTWTDPAEVFLRAWEFADDKTGTARKMILPAWNQVIEGAFLFWETAPNVCKIEPKTVEIKGKNLDLFGRGLEFFGRADKVFPEEIRLSGFGPFSLSLKKV